LLRFADSLMVILAVTNIPIVDGDKPKIILNDALYARRGVVAMIRTGVLEPHLFDEECVIRPDD